ncbi:hypothetical protein [Thermococcus sp.]|uniref:hypothetical protein n=1 Tax=Thermococcus sp. TaxID=35749 RepID=UPI0026253515|nr:hypothetical protein [Thermococcus sp.]
MNGSESGVEAFEKKASPKVCDSSKDVSILKVLSGIGRVNERIFAGESFSSDSFPPCPFGALKKLESTQKCPNSDKNHEP